MVISQPVAAPGPSASTVAAGIAMQDLKAGYDAEVADLRSQLAAEKKQAENQLTSQKAQLKALVRISGGISENRSNETPHHCHGSRLDQKLFQKLLKGGRGTYHTLQSETAGGTSRRVEILDLASQQV